MHYTPDVDNYNHYKPHTEIVRYHGSETDSEGMTNKSSSCWMISVIQALRASDAFKKIALEKGEKDPVKKELFHLFNIVEGKNGQKKRTVKSHEINSFRALLRDAGLPVKETGGYSVVRFMRFFLEYLHADRLVYYAGSKKQKDFLFVAHPTDSIEKRSLEAVIQQNRLAFATKEMAPTFLPILLKRPLIKGTTHRYEASRTPVEPSSTINIPIARDASTVPYKLVSIVITRDSISHAYSYVVEKSGWVDYNNHKVVIHSAPKTKKRSKTSVHTPYEDACKHSEILIYERAAEHTTP